MSQPRWARIAIGIVLFVAAAAAVGWPLPYYSEGPGPARDVLSSIIYEGRPRYEPAGHMELTTVRYQQLTGLTALRAWIDHTLAIVPASTVYPPNVPIDVTKQRSISEMDQSKIDATAAALRALHGYPKDHGAGALIEATVSDCPADGELFPGDIITAIDGTPVRDTAQAGKLFDKIPVDQPLHFDLNVDGSVEHATFTREPCGPKREPLVGISMLDVFPFDITFSSEDIGGPSAGLMWALGLYELLTPGDLTAGRTIAGTGQIAPDGTVYPIGGIRDKVVAAERAGATLFLAPADNMAELEGVDTGDMQVVSVANLDDALAALRQGRPSG
jgi:PDZ domain-containing protein